jgi:hypothetical protein
MCGAKVIRNRLTFKNLISHFSEQFLNYDNKFIQTIYSLIIRPEDIINNYVQGTRKKFINPINFFAISLSISGVYLFILRKFFPNVMDFSSLVQGEQQQKVTQEFANFVSDYNSLFYFALVPLLALISRIVFFKNKFNYTEHIVIYLYSMSLGAIATIVIAVFILIIKPELLISFSMYSNLGLVLFHSYLLKKVFQLNRKQVILKTLLFIVIFGISYIIFSMILVVLLTTFTDVNLKELTPPTF